MKKFLRFSLVALFAVLGMSNAMADDVTDVLTSTEIGVTSYKDWSKTFTSNAVYAGNTTANNGAIQMRSKNNSGIVTTASGGKIKSITIEWNDNTPNQPGGDNPQTRTLQIYGNNTAYTATSDLYGSSKGTLLGSSTYDGTAKVTINVDGDYTFIGIRSEANALYLDKITIVWESTAATKVDAELAFPESAYTAYLNKAFTAPTLTNPNNVTVEYTSSNEEAATVDASTGAITLVAKGTTTITAKVPDTNTSYKGSASYTLTVEAADIANTPETAYTVAKAIELIDAGDGLSAEVYVKGIISQIDKFNDDKSITYWISDDGTTNNQFECYHGKGLNGADFTALTDLKKGATVIVKGKMKKFKSGENITYEMDKNNVLISYDESTAGGDPEVIEATIAELYSYTAATPNIKLTINNGKVVYVDGKSVYVRDGEKAMLFYDCDLTLPLNATVSGTVIVKLDIYKGLHEVKNNGSDTNADNLEITESSDVAAPVEATFDKLASKDYTNDLIIIKNQSVIEDDGKWYIQNGDAKIQLFKKNADYSSYVSDTKKYDITAIATVFNSNAQLTPISFSETTGIQNLTIDADVNAPMYNLKGERVDANYRGVVIKGGKKTIQK
jgi:hypothetical protein